MAVKITIGGQPSKVAPVDAEPAEAFDDLPGWRQTMRLVLPVLLEAGIKHVRVGFSGSGDSGEIDSVELDSTWGHEMLKHEITAPKTTTAWTGDGWSTDTSLVGQKLEDVLGQMAEDWASETGVDWYNNDGGYGHVELDLSVDPPTFDCDIGQYETVSNHVTGDEGVI